MRRPILAWLVAGTLCTTAAHVLAAPPAPIDLKAHRVHPCADPSCGSPALTKTPSYSTHIERDGTFTAEVTLEQPCSCVRPLTLLLAFTPPGTTQTKERPFALKVSPGVSTVSIKLTPRELAAAKIVPGRYAITFALYDERDQPAGQALSGNPFTYGTSKSKLTKRPALPNTIARDATLEVPFEFGNDGDTASPVTALLVFTRPGETSGIEYYLRDLQVPPGGAKHVISLPAQKRRELRIGAGAWLVTASAFDSAGQRMGSFAGNILTIGSVQISLPSAPRVSAVIESYEEFKVQLTVQNRGDAEDEITAVVIFSRNDLPKPIEHAQSGIRVGPGTSKHSLVLTPKDRAALGIDKGQWSVAVTALDRTGKRLETHRGHDLVIR